MVREPAPVYYCRLMGTHHRGTPTEVRALDAYIKLMRSADTVGGRMERRLARPGLTESQFGVLEALFHLGPMFQRDLGMKLLTTGGNITHIVDNLEKQGLVRRERSVQDRRLIAVHLTDKGRGLIERIFPSHVEAIVDLFSALDPAEQDELGRLCKKLGKRNAAHSSDETL